MTVAETVRAEELLSEKLDSFVNQYVAIFNHEVVDHDDDYDELVDRILSEGTPYDRVFRVLSGENTTFVF